jgi:hypothetical protein
VSHLINQPFSTHTNGTAIATPTSSVPNVQPTSNNDTSAPVVGPVPASPTAISISGAAPKSANSSLTRGYLSCPIKTSFILHPSREHCIITYCLRCSPTRSSSSFTPYFLPTRLGPSSDAGGEPAPVLTGFSRSPSIQASGPPGPFQIEAGSNRCGSIMSDEVNLGGRA